MMDVMSRNDEILMLAVLRLGDQACASEMVKEIKKRSGKKLTFGSLWVSLDVLAKKGLIEKHLADTAPERGGRKKVFYALTREGIEALKETQEFHESLWEGAPVLLKQQKRGG